MRPGSYRLPKAGFSLALLAAAAWLLKGDLTSGQPRGEALLQSEWVFLDVPGASRHFVRVQPGEALGLVLEREAAGLRPLLPRAALEAPLEEGDQVLVRAGPASGSPVLVLAPLSERVRFLMGRPLNVNRATAREMELLPGVGPKLGQRIEAFRNLSGEFRSADDLLSVPGVGRALVSKIQSRICFAGRVRTFPLLAPGSFAGGPGNTLPESLRPGS